MREKVFVYGTLMAGMPLHAHMQGCDLVPGYGDHAKVWGKALIDLGAFPGAVEGGPEESIVGEIYLVDKRTMIHLDYVEGVPDLYRRVQVSASGHRAWMYVLATARMNAIKVPNGDWRSYVASRTRRG